MTSTPESFLTRWNLIPDGTPIVTRTSELLSVRFQGHAAMLKIAKVDEERRGNGLMVWWNGNGAARIFAHAGDALLMGRLDGDGALAAMSRRGADDEASLIICDTVAALHACHTMPRPETVPLSEWFEALPRAADRHGGLFATAAATASALLGDQRDVVVLHGDIHHGNILCSTERGWVAIDPKGLLGERGFDFANLFCNPDDSVATAPGRLSRQATLVSARAGLEPARLLKWILAYAALSAAWLIEDGAAPDGHLAVAGFVAAELATTS
jgi:streptomycin 6-kinase